MRPACCRLGEGAKFHRRDDTAAALPRSLSVLERAVFGRRPRAAAPRAEKRGGQLTQERTTAPSRRAFMQISARGA